MWHGNWVLIKTPKLRRATTEKKPWKCQSCQTSANSTNVFGSALIWSSIPFLRICASHKWNHRVGPKKSDKKGCHKSWVLAWHHSLLASSFPWLSFLSRFHMDGSFPLMSSLRSFCRPESGSDFGRNDKILTPNGPSLGLPNEERRLNPKPIPNPNPKFKLGNLGFWRLVQNMTIDYIIIYHLYLYLLAHCLSQTCFMWWFCSWQLSKALGCVSKYSFLSFFNSWKGICVGETGSVLTVYACLCWPLILSTIHFCVLSKVIPNFNEWLVEARVIPKKKGITTSSSQVELLMFCWSPTMEVQPEMYNHITGWAWLGRNKSLHWNQWCAWGVYWSLNSNNTN